MPLSKRHALTWKDHNKQNTDPQTSYEGRGGETHITDEKRKRIIDMISDGWNNEEVAEFAGVSTVTVSKIRKVLGASDERKN